MPPEDPKPPPSVDELSERMDALRELARQLKAEADLLVAEAEERQRQKDRDGGGTPA